LADVQAKACRILGIIRLLSEATNSLFKIRWMVLVESAIEIINKAIKKSHLDGWLLIIYLAVRGAD
jgi:hypothetical protein